MADSSAGRSAPAARVRWRLCAFPVAQPVLYSIEIGGSAPPLLQTMKPWWLEGLTSLRSPPPRSPLHFLQGASKASRQALLEPAGAAGQTHRHSFPNRQTPSNSSSTILMVSTRDTMEDFQDPERTSQSSHTTSLFLGMFQFLSVVPGVRTSLASCR